VVQVRRGWPGIPGHVGQNDADFTLLQEELNAPISRPLRPNFVIAPILTIDERKRSPKNRKR